MAENTEKNKQPLASEPVNGYVADPHYKGYIVRGKFLVNGYDVSIRISGNTMIINAEGDLRIMPRAANGIIIETT